MVRIKSLRELAVALLAFSFVSVTAHVVDADPSTYLNHLARRQYITSDQAKSSYDYVIAGGGLAGLVLASRLSENPKVSVLVLEAGKSGDDVKARIDSPAGAYYQSIVGTEYDWNFTTVSQPNLANRRISQPRGRILGGSTAMNAMYLVRPSKTEMDAWKDLLASNGGDATKAARWGWDSLYTYMKKSESFTPPPSAISSVVNITVDASLFGNSGPMRVSYPGAMVNVTTNWTLACANAGMPENKSPNGGVTLGGWITASSINPSNFTRSYSRPAYIDSLPPRSNLDIMSESTVLKFTMQDKQDGSGNWVVDSVQYAKDSSAQNNSVVSVNKEFILAAGALSTPKILMNSGVGPKDTLQSAGINMVLESPGVGQRLQDHLTAPVSWKSNWQTAGDIHQTTTDFSKSAEFLSIINDAVAFANATLLMEGTNNATTFQKAILAALNDTFVDQMVPSYSSQVKEGYKTIYNLIANTFWGDGVAQMELLMSVISPGGISIQAAMQHPFSIGRVYINSTNPWDPIQIDPGFFSHWADKVLLRQGLKLVRRVGQTYGALGAIGDEVVPGPNYTTDDALEGVIVNDPNNGANSQYHPTGTAAMLPQELGGVVDADAKVYGMANVRVVDGSVFPFEFAAHLASAGFGVAEQAADLIKQQSYSVSAKKVTSSADSTSSASMVGFWIWTCVLGGLMSIFA